jgi:hypothetical protein
MRQDRVDRRPKPLTENELDRIRKEREEMVRRIFE